MKLRLVVVATLLNLLEAKVQKIDIADFVEGNQIGHRQSHKHELTRRSVGATVQDWWPRWNDPEEPQDTQDLEDDWASDEDEPAFIRPAEQEDDADEVPDDEEEEVKNRKGNFIGLYLNQRYILLFNLYQ